MLTGIHMHVCAHTHTTYTQRGTVVSSAYLWLQIKRRLGKASQTKHIQMDHIFLQTAKIGFSFLVPVCGSLVPYHDPVIIPEGRSSQGRQGGDENYKKAL